ncbi:MAG: OmpA family protein [Bacteroidota bacterium]|jgi:outer membrane protein OmpA-like peptidoglycan-associated protein
MKTVTKKIFVAILASIALLLLVSTVNAQEKNFRDQAWRFGINLGVNNNSASLGFQSLHSTPPIYDFDKPSTETEDNINGRGYGGYGGAFVEYLSTSWWGVQLRVSYDMRDAVVTDGYATPNTEFDTRMAYMSFEPLFRIDQHMIPNLSLVVGPLIAANIHGTYAFKADAAGPVTEENVKIPDRPVASLGVTAGVAYDIEIGSGVNSSVYLSPFFDYSWIAAQRKSLISTAQNSTSDIWSTQTFRFGLRLSWESRNPPPEPMTEIPAPVKPRVVEAPPPRVVNHATMTMPPNNEITAQDITGYFPILPYVFFEEGNQEIPDRYILLEKSGASNFNEAELGKFDKGELTEKETNVDQLMVTYHNVINVYADRMKKNPKEKLILRGSDPLGKDGKAFAYKVKNYMVETFQIEPGRITVEEEAPRKPSGSELTDPSFAGLIDDENRRVGFVFANESMYKPVSYATRDESAINNDMIFSVDNMSQLKSWDVSISGSSRTMNFGPFKTNSARINPAPLMRGIYEDRFKAKVTMMLKDGKTISETHDFKLIKSKDLKMATRYLMIFEYNKSDAVASYEKKIRNEIVPGMNSGNAVIVHGHTDIIGNEAANQQLSEERSNEAKRIVDDELAKTNKRVDVQAVGVGQTNVQYTFDNQQPEGRMYNRNVFVETIR